jgi:hypothetical protein
MIRCLLALLLLGTLHATDDPPAWAIPGILMVESSSFYRSDGSICYVDRKTGSAGELGCCQVTRAAFRCVAKRGESFRRLATDSAFAVEIATRYLRWIYEHRAGHDWLRAIGMYNAGFGTDRASMNRRIKYLNKVRTKGQP